VVDECGWSAYCTQPLGLTTFGTTWGDGLGPYPARPVVACGAAAAEATGGALPARRPIVVTAERIVRRSGRGTDMVGLSASVGLKLCKGV
jgi:hypothetical protein